MPKRPIITAEPNVKTSRAKIGNAGREFGSAHTITQRDAICLWHAPRRITEFARAQILLAEQQKRRLPNTTRNHDKVLGTNHGKTVSERAPNLEFVARPELRQYAGHLPEH